MKQGTAESSLRSHRSTTCPYILEHAPCSTAYPVSSTRSMGSLREDTISLLHSAQSLTWSRTDAPHLACWSSLHKPFLGGASSSNSSSVSTSPVTTSTCTPCFIWVVATRATKRLMPTAARFYICTTLIEYGYLPLIFGLLTVTDRSLSLLCSQRTFLHRTVSALLLFATAFTISASTNRRYHDIHATRFTSKS